MPHYLLSSLCQVFASDSDEGDNARVAYSIYETEKSDIRKVFDINTETGEIILMQQPAQLGETRPGDRTGPLLGAQAGNSDCS